MSFNEFTVNIDYGYKEIVGIRSPHLHFQQLWKEKDKILNQLLTFNNWENLYAEMSNETSANNYIHYVKINNLDGTSYLHYPLFYKISKNKIKLIKDYLYVHLQNTLLKELLGGGEKNYKLMSTWVVHQLYYYRFFNLSSIQDVNNSVVSDIGDLIALIIKREYTAYKEFNTAGAINALRKAHMTSRLFLAGTMPTNFTFRK